MAGFKDKGFSDRISAAAKAREAALEKFKSRPKPDDPEMLAKAAARKATADAREVKAAEREAERIAHKAREAEEQKAREIAEAAEKAMRAENQIAEAVRIMAEQKAARDARYAARKARKP